MRDSKEQPSTRSQRDFVASVVHELRTPITVVAGLLDVLSQRHRSLADDEVDEFLGRMRRQTDRLYAMVAAVLDLTHVGSGRLRARVVPVDLARAISDALLNAPPAPDGQNVVVSVPDEMSVNVDPRLFEQVITNLLVNAYLYGGDQVFIEARATVTGVTLIVSDDGAGVPEDLVPDLFEQFARGENAVGRPGSGLGLAIAKGFVEAFGGNISYIPRDPQGASFRILLRPGDEEVSNIRGGLRGRRNRDQLVARILIVDDEPDMRFLLKALFESAGHEAIEAHHGAAALEAAHELSPHLVITDLMMPVMDGRELITRMRTDPKMSSIPILAVSAHQPLDGVAADATVGKPFLLDEVLEAAIDLLERRGGGGRA